MYSDYHTSPQNSYYSNGNMSSINREIQCLREKRRLNKNEMEKKPSIGTKLLDLMSRLFPLKNNGTKV